MFTLENIAQKTS